MAADAGIGPLPPALQRGRTPVKWRAQFGLMPLHVWGISFDLLKTLALQSGAEAHAALGYTGWQLELIGLGYQFGYLMLPVIGAATLWIAMNRRLLLVLLERT